MKAIIQDETVLRAIKPLEIASYLRLNGWQQKELIPDQASTWTRSSDGPDFEILLPLRANLGDFERRVFEVLQTLALAEKRSQLDILEDITTSNADIVRARLLPGHDEDGALPLEQGVWAFQQTRDLMLAAACAAIAPRQVFARRKPEQAMRYLKDARIGQTKRGSYVITVLSPVPPVLSMPGLDFGDGQEIEPFERRTVRVLAEALTAAAEGVQEAAASGSIDPLLHAVPRGLSANLCDAIVGLHESGGNQGVEIGFSWARSRSIPASVKPSIFLSPDSIPFLKETSSVFRQTSVVEGSEVIGSVRKLERRHPAPGNITIVGTADGEPRTVVVELPDDLYARAIEAHQERIPVSCTGELAREGKSYRLKNPRDFMVLLDE